VTPIRERIAGLRDPAHLLTVGQAVRMRAYTRLLARSFASFGADSILEPPIKLHGASGIHIGAGVHVGLSSWLLTVTPGATLEIGDGTVMSGFCVLSAARRVVLGRKVLLGRNVYIADHNHGHTRPGVPIMDQPLEDLAPVSVGDGAWLGQNAVILPGSRIGAGAVVGANSVVRGDVPDHHVAIGAPSRVVRDLRSGA